MRLHRDRITIGTRENGETGVAEPKTQPACAAKEINGSRSGDGLDPSTNIAQISRIRCTRGRRKPECVTPAVWHRRAPNGSGFSHRQIPLSTAGRTSRN
jgi:hypothetical protein